MMGDMTETDEQSPRQEPPGRDVLDLRRSTADAPIGGVAGGIAEHFGIDPLLVRIAFVVLVLVGGSSLILYLGLWLVLPKDDGTASHLARALNLTENEPQLRRIGIIAVAIVAALSFVGDVSVGWFGARDAVWLLVLVGLIVWVFSVWPSRSGGQSASATPPATPDTPSARPPSDACGPPPMAHTALDPNRPRIVPPVRPKPKKARDPRLTILTLSIAALVCAGLAIWELSGHRLDAEAYAVAVLAAVGLGLLVGSLFGNGRALIVVGILASLVLAFQTVGGIHPVGQRVLMPKTAAEIVSDYDFGLGEVVLDLTAIDPAELENRTIDIGNGIGKTLVILPADLEVNITADVGAGGLDILGRTANGTGVSLTHSSPHPDALQLDLSAGLGQIEVINE